jgi:hypothetical protein
MDPLNFNLKISVIIDQITIIINSEKGSTKALNKWQNNNNNNNNKPQD